MPRRPRRYEGSERPRRGEGATRMSVSVYKLDSLPPLASARGFTLIEVVIVMAIVAILTAIALPNYSEYIVRSNRSTAQSFLTDAASRQAQFFLDRRTYATTVAAPHLGHPPALPAPSALRCPLLRSAATRGRRCLIRSAPHRPGRKRMIAVA